MWAVTGGRAGVRGSQADFSCCPPASFWAAWFWGAARAPHLGLVAPCCLVCLHHPAPCAAPNKRQHRARHELTPPSKTRGWGQAETFAPFHPILEPALLGRTSSITKLQTPAARPELVPGPGAQPSPIPTSPRRIPVPRATSPAHSPLVPVWGHGPAHRPAAPVRRHVAVDLEARGVVRGEDGINPILLLSARVDVKAVPGPGAWSGAQGWGGKEEGGWLINELISWLAISSRLLTVLPALVASLFPALLLRGSREAVLGGTQPPRGRDRPQDPCDAWGRWVPAGEEGARGSCRQGTDTLPAPGPSQPHPNPRFECHGRRKVTSAHLWGTGRGKGAFGLVSQAG